MLLTFFPHITKTGLSSQSTAIYFYSIKQQTLESPLLQGFFVCFFSTLEITRSINTNQSEYLPASPTLAVPAYLSIAPYYHHLHHPGVITTPIKILI
jgi:hypothetical protein